MIKSMTAFGRGYAPLGTGNWLLEIKCVNSKFLDFQLRIPASLNALEDRLKKHIGHYLNRGRISVFISVNGATINNVKLTLNHELLAEYKKILQQLEQEMGAGFEKPNLGILLTNRDIVINEEDVLDNETMWNSLLPALTQALEDAGAMRVAEGEFLANDLRQRLDAIELMVGQIEKVSPQIVANYKQRLQERIAKLLDDIEPDRERLAHEVAIAADKCDISEEVVRARSHINQFRGFLQSDEPVGRKLDFLVQELNREANTMGSKSPDVDAINVVVACKAELEKIREQVQNIE